MIFILKNYANKHSGALSLYIYQFLLNRHPDHVYCYFLHVLAASRKQSCRIRSIYNPATPEKKSWHPKKITPNLKKELPR
jgi:hypothetical protein